MPLPPGRVHFTSPLAREPALLSYALLLSALLHSTAGGMRAAFAARLSPQRVLQLARSPSSRTAPLASRMGQAASMLPAGWWPAERGLAAAAAGSARGKAAAGKGGSRAASPMDQPAGEDEDLW